MSWFCGFVVLVGCVFVVFCVFAGFGVCFAFVFAGFVGFLLVVDMFCCCCWFCRAVCLLVLCVCCFGGLCVCCFCVFVGFGVCFAFVFAGFVGFLLAVDMFCCCCSSFCRAVCLLVLWVCCFCELCACCFVGSLFLLLLLGREVESNRGKELSRWKHEKALGAAGHAPTAECGHS